jgi:hypothetical protein
MERDTERMLADMLSMAKLYVESTFPEGFRLSDGSVPEWRRYVYIGGLVAGHKYRRTVLMRILEAHQDGDVDDDTLLDCVRFVMAVVARGRVRKGGSSTLNVQSSGNVIARMARDEDKDFKRSLYAAFAAGRGSFSVSGDDEIRKVLQSEPVYEHGLRAGALKALLYGLEWARDRKGLPGFDDDTLTVEHIMPQTLTDGWRKSLTPTSLANHAAVLHTLGNLALTNHNAEMSNKSFSEKKETYRESSYGYTRDLGLSDASTWQETDIKRRGKQLTDAFLALWPLPDDMAGRGAYDEAGMVSLRDAVRDGSLLVSRKPFMIYFEDDCVIGVRTWRDCLTTVIERLKMKDGEGLRRAAMLVGKPLVVDDGGDVQLSGSLSARSVVRCIERLVSGFDRLVGTELVDTVMFDLKQT